MAATAKAPQFSIKLGWNKELKRNDRVILRVALHRIPVAHINVDVQKDRVRVDTLKNTRKFVLETQYPAGVNVDENGASATEEYGYLILQIPIKSSESEAAAVPKQQQVQLEVEKQKQRQLKKKQRKAAQAAEVARATAIANMAGVDAAAVVGVSSPRDTENQTLKRRKRGDTAENERERAGLDRPTHAWSDASDGEIDQDGEDASLDGAADAQADEDDAAPAAMDEPVESGQYEELRQQYELVKDELGEEERAELERELQELYEMEADPTGRGVEGAVLDTPLTKKKLKKKKKRKAGGVAEEELSSALEIAEEVAARRDDEQEKVVSKEEATRAWQEDQKAKQRERKARKKQAKAALVHELRRSGQASGSASGKAKQGAREEGDKQHATTKRNEGEIVTLNSRKNGGKTKDDEAQGMEVALLPPQKRKRREEAIHSLVVQHADEDEATTGKPESEQTLKKKTKKQKKMKDSDATAQADVSDSFRVDSEKEQTGEKAKKRKKDKKKKKEKSAAHARAESSHNRPQSPTERKGKRGSDGILKEPRSSGKQLKRVSFSPKPQTKSIPAIPYTRNKWLW